MDANRALVDKCVRFMAKLTRLEGSDESTNAKCLEERNKPKLVPANPPRGNQEP